MPTIAKNTVKCKKRHETRKKCREMPHYALLSFTFHERLVLSANKCIASFICFINLPTCMQKCTKCKKRKIYQKKSLNTFHFSYFVSIFMHLAINVQSAQRRFFAVLKDKWEKNYFQGKLLTINNYVVMFLSCLQNSIFFVKHRFHCVLQRATVLKTQWRIVSENVMNKFYILSMFHTVSLFHCCLQIACNRPYNMWLLPQKRVLAPKTIFHRRRFSMFDRLVSAFY